VMALLRPVNYRGHPRLLLGEWDCCDGFREAHGRDGPQGNWVLQQGELDRCKGQHMSMGSRSVWASNCLVWIVLLL
jgi:hypothetical protein